jgi:hypothetical protein
MSPDEHSQAIQSECEIHRFDQTSSHSIISPLQSTGNLINHRLKDIIVESPTSSSHMSKLDDHIIVLRPSSSPKSIRRIKKAEQTQIKQRKRNHLNTSKRLNNSNQNTKRNVPIFTLIQNILYTLFLYQAGCTQLFRIYMFSYADLIIRKFI